MVRIKLLFSWVWVLTSAGAMHYFVHTNCLPGNRSNSIFASFNSVLIELLCASHQVCISQIWKPRFKDMRYFTLSLAPRPHRNKWRGSFSGRDCSHRLLIPPALLNQAAQLKLLQGWWEKAVISKDASAFCSERKYCCFFNYQNKYYTWKSYLIIGNRDL